MSEVGGGGSGRGGEEGQWPNQEQPGSWGGGGVRPLRRQERTGGEGVRAPSLQARRELHRGKPAGEGAPDHTASRKRNGPAESGRGHHPPSEMRRGAGAEKKGTKGNGEGAAWSLTNLHMVHVCGSVILGKAD